MSSSSSEVRPTDTLFIRRPGRLLHDTSVGPEGQRVFTLYYNEKEVAFDDPVLIPFGERLLKEHRFVAEQARSWSEDGYEWETLADLFEALVGEGVLEVEGSAAAAEPDPVSPSVEEGAQQGSIADARAWTPEACVSISKEVFGVAVEVGNLESLMRCVRIAHPALDVGGRQVGERNVFPTQLRLDLPTNYRQCPYLGSRHEHENPMNMTGLAPVVECWRDVLHNLRVLKQEFFRRRPRAREGLTVIDLYVLGSIALCVPTFMLHRASDRVANGQLPLEISALFRVMDGTRITTRDMLLTVSPQFGPDVVTNAERFLHYADRELLLVTDRGVCAGPPAMIETFLSAVMSVEAETATLTATPTSLLGDVKPATSYAIAACELETVVDQFSLRQQAIFEHLLAYLAERPDMQPLEERLRARLEAGLAEEALAYLFLREESASRSDIYQNLSHIIRRCHELRGESGEPVIAPFEDDVDDTDPEVLEVHAVLARTLPALPRDTSLELALACVRSRRMEQQTFPRVTELQAECNTILGRSPPSREFGELDIAKAWPVANVRAALSEALGITLGPRNERSIVVNPPKT